MDEDDQKTGLGQLSELLDGLLPKILLRPAGTAISRLIGSEIDIPAACLEQQAQRIKDATAARSHVTQALATQTAKTAVTDPEIREFTEANMVATAYRRQINKKSVALKTIKNLQTDPLPEQGDGPSEDWLAQFERRAEDASSDQLRTLFARLLAGEIRKPCNLCPCLIKTRRAYSTGFSLYSLY